MSASPGPRPIVILGPTAGGKSELAVALAEQVCERGEVLGADSMQIYRHLNAGTAKPEVALRRRAPHHLIDIIEPATGFTVADWLTRAERLIAHLRRHGKRPIIVGGTNLYLKVLLEGMFEAPPQDADFRAQLNDVDTHDLHQRLRQRDPDAAARIHPNDRKRLIRALEVHHLTGQPISAQQRQWSDQVSAPNEGVREPSDIRNSTSESHYRHAPILIGLHWPAEAINPRINRRVKAMFHPEKVEAPDSTAAPAAPPESLPDEVRRLDALGRLGPPDSQARAALGYKQVLAALHGRCSMSEAMEQTKIQTRRFAKQQRTWLRRFRGVHWLPAVELDADDRLSRALDAVAAEDAAPG